MEGLSLGRLRPLGNFEFHWGLDPKSRFSAKLFSSSFSDSSLQLLRTFGVCGGSVQGPEGESCQWILSLTLMSVAAFLTSCSMGQIPTSGSSTSLPFSTTSRFLHGSGLCHSDRQLGRGVLGRSFGLPIPSTGPLRQSGGGRQGVGGAVKEGRGGDWETGPGRRWSRRGPAERVPEQS